jgi:hypothetical protein
MVSVLTSIAYDKEFSDHIRACAMLALTEVKEMNAVFNREVGW